MKEEEKLSWPVRLRRRREWVALPNAKEEIESMCTLESVEIPEFWLKLKSVTDGNNQPKFGLLTSLMC